MIIKFYSTNSPKNSLSKDLTELKLVNGNLQDTCTINDPVIKFSKNAEILASNYAYIQDFNRYYFITGFDVINGTVIVHLHVDVLTTYADDIKGSEGRVIRSYSNGSKYIRDDMITAYETRRVITRKLGEGFTKSTTYLYTVGG